MIWDVIFSDDDDSIKQLVLARENSAKKRKVMEEKEKEETQRRDKLKEMIQKKEERYEKDMEDLRVNCNAASEALVAVKEEDKLLAEEVKELQQINKKYVSWGFDEEPSGISDKREEEVEDRSVKQEEDKKKKELMDKIYEIESEIRRTQILVKQKETLVDRWEAVITKKQQRLNEWKADAKQEQDCEEEMRKRLLDRKIEVESLRTVNTAWTKIGYVDTEENEELFKENEQETKKVNVVENKKKKNKDNNNEETPVGNVEEVVTVQKVKSDGKKVCLFEVGFGLKEVFVNLGLWISSETSFFMDY